MSSVSKACKRPGLGTVLGVALLGLGGVTVPASWAAAPTGPAKSTATGSPSASVEASPIPLSAAEGKALDRDFGKAQKAELRALLDTQKRELRDLDASQKRRLQDWDEREKQARRKFFSQATLGAQKRAYMQDLKARRENFRRAMADERRLRVHEQEVHLKALKDDQAAKYKEFSAALKEHRTPARGLWP